MRKWYNLIIILRIKLAALAIFFCFRFILFMTELDRIDSFRSDFSKIIEAFLIGIRFDIVISGYTDNKGSAEYNQELSKNRAQTVYNYLISNGISAERISKNWFGEDKPVKENDTDINRAFNRRVEIKIKN